MVNAKWKFHLYRNKATKDIQKIASLSGEVTHGWGLKNAKLTTEEHANKMRI